MGNTIIVIEDDETLADNIRDFLERQGYEAIACGTAEEALEMITSIQPDLVVSDHNLPKMSGTELVARVREIDPQIKAIMMTGDDRVRRRPVPPRRRDDRRALAYRESGRCGVRIRLDRASQEAIQLVQGHHRHVGKLADRNGRAPLGTDHRDALHLALAEGGQR